MGVGVGLAGPRLVRSELCGLRYPAPRGVGRSKTIGASTNESKKEVVVYLYNVHHDNHDDSINWAGFRPTRCSASNTPEETRCSGQACPCHGEGGSGVERGRVRAAAANQA